MKVFAHIMSYLFHPLLMATYGVILTLMFTYLSIYPNSIKLVIIGGVFVITGVIPALFILLLVHNGVAGDVELTNGKERTVPYLIFIVAILLCIFFLNKLLMPFWLLAMLMGVCVALIIALVINFSWKISAHMIGIGGLLGGIMGLARLHTVNPYWAFMIVFILAGLLAMSRIILNKHTQAQTYAGFCLGFVSTFCASLLSYVYLFI